MKLLKIMLIGAVLSACGDDELPEPQDITTEGGWKYRYINIPDKTDGWKIEIQMDSAWNHEAHNAWASVIAPIMLNYSGYDDVTPADKAAKFEDWDSNAAIYQSSSSVTLELYIEEGEEEEFMETVIAMVQEYSLDSDYFETLKGQIQDNLAQAEAQKDSAYVMEKISSYQLVEQSNENVITPYDLTIEALADLTLDDVEEWIEYSKALPGLRIGVAGAENPESLNPYIDELLNGFSKDPNALAIPELNPTNQYLRIVYENPEATKSVFSFLAIWPEPIDDNQSFYTVDFASQIETGQFGSKNDNMRLASIRDELRASYGFSTNWFPLNFTQFSYGVGGESDLEHQAKVLERLVKINQNMIDTPPSEEEFKAAQSENMDWLKQEYKDENAGAYAMAIEQVKDIDYNWSSEISYIENLTLEEISAQITANFPRADAWHELILSSDASNLEADCVIDDWRNVPSCYE